MKKYIRVLMLMVFALAMQCVLVGCTKKIDVDYDSPVEFVTAAIKGEAAEGETILVTASHDSNVGLIYSEEDASLGATINVIMSTEDGNKKIKKGEKVVVKVDSIFAVGDTAYTISCTYVSMSK